MLAKINRRGPAQVATTLLLAVVATAGWQLSSHSSDASIARIAPMANSSVAFRASGAPQAAQPDLGLITAGQDEHHDLSKPLRDIPAITDHPAANKLANDHESRFPLPGHKDAKDAAEQNSFTPAGSTNAVAPNIPALGANFAG